jgi:predicted DNA-binding transcriptional regulator AlpA
MEKLSIREASERFGLSRARLYQLLDKGIVAGYRSDKKGRGADSWIDGQSLCTHIEDRKYGGPKAMPEGDYLPTRVAAQKTGYTAQHINRLIRQGSVAVRKRGRVNLVYLPNLLKYLEK